MGDANIDALYEQVRALVSARADAAQAGLTEVAPGIRVLALRTPTLPPAAHTNVYLVGPEKGPVAVVDPGSPYPEEQAILDTILSEIPIARVLLTHHHGDHTGGAAALAAKWNVPIAAHALTAKRLAGRIAVHELLDDGDEVHGAICVHTPGHADGHLVFELGDVAIAGDMVAGVGTILIDPDEGNMTQYLASLERMRARNERVLLPAHGPAIRDGGAKLTEYLAHRRMREQRVIDALAGAAKTTAELVEVVYSDTPRVLWGLAERSLLAHLAKLVEDGTARHEGGGLWSR
ncbi:MAG: MBL fold metallo-hydrolase [Myxococcota bacterium]|nr:MBL fold metallo-hydrolase [Deltaproteobacteria bacterium]MDQ3338047.1 MBL fold metallo-hydrolase [Myxococcota bacterium]